MNIEKVLKSLQDYDFKKLINKSQKFEPGSTIYAKEIENEIFLLFVVLKNEKPKDIHSFIAYFDSSEHIGVQEPKEVMFYHLISKVQDFHYFEKYLNAHH
ncbi:hypothetical protein [Epilithonimonas sp.]|uniref:hypothetical protein n=1 Tax=Epilithonimonas sp. TaxID=2894511 RepID=UPI002FDEC954